MTRFAVLALLCLACLAAASSASASSASSPCVYKVSGMPVYMQFRGVLTSGACDAVGEGANGTIVKVYRQPVGQIRCAFALSKFGLTSQMYSSSSTYGPLWCKTMGPKLVAQGWRKLF
jgi:hypothetical protein